MMYCCYVSCYFFIWKRYRWLQIYQIPRSISLRELTGFRERFNQQLNTRGLSCATCNTSMGGDQNEDIDWLSDNEYVRWMASTRICYECLRPICLDCSDWDGVNDEGFSLHGCSVCEKRYCNDCVQMPRCSYCSDKICRECGDMKTCNGCCDTMDAMCESCLRTCDGCNRTRCESCAPYLHCEGTNCPKSHCTYCYDGVEYSIKFCEECESHYCLECKVKLVKRGGDVGCRGCAVDTIPLLVQQNAKLTKEVEELRETVRSMS